MRGRRSGGRRVRDGSYNLSWRLLGFSCGEIIEIDAWDQTDLRLGECYVGVIKQLEDGELSSSSTSLKR